MSEKDFGHYKWVPNWNHLQTGDWVKYRIYKNRTMTEFHDGVGIVVDDILVSQALTTYELSDFLNMKKLEYQIIYSINSNSSDFLPYSQNEFLRLLNHEIRPLCLRGSYTIDYHYD